MCLIVTVCSLFTVLRVTLDTPVFRPLCSLRLTTCVHNSEGYNKQLLYIYKTRLSSQTLIYWY